MVKDEPDALVSAEIMVKTGMAILPRKLDKEIAAGMVTDSGGALTKLTATQAG